MVLRLTGTSHSFGISLRHLLSFNLPTRGLFIVEANDSIVLGCP